MGRATVRPVPADHALGRTHPFVTDGLDNVMTGRPGNDRLDGRTGFDTVSDASAPGPVSASPEKHEPQAIGVAGTDTLAGFERITGGGFDDRGDGLANVLDGGAADGLLGGAGNDTYLVDNPHDRVVEAVGEDIDSVQSGVSFTLPAVVGDLTLTGRRGLGSRQCPRQRDQR
jgi:Ca2+-binding RTX toxin-like protein